MSSFFSEVADEVAVLEETFADVDEFLMHLEGLENDLVRAALLVTGDREFPGALRDEVLAVIALERATKVPIPTPGWRQARLTRTSPLTTALAALFARIEAQGVLTRFGQITADLPAVLEARERHDEARALAR